MKNILKKVFLLAGLFSTNSYSISFTQTNIPLAHPANGDLLQLNQDYLAVSGHSVNDRWLSLIKLDGFSVLPLAIPADAQFFSKMKLANADKTSIDEHLIFLTNQGVSVFSTADNTVTSLVKSPSIFPVIDDKRLRHINVVFDIDNSGLDDLLIPDFHAYHLWLQQSDGKFSHHRLAISAKAETYDDVPRYAARKPYLIDSNLDGKMDVVFVRDAQLLSFLQQADGSFSESATTLIPGMEISLDSEANTRPGDGRNFEGLIINNLHDLTDLDGDGMVDLIIRREVFNNALDQNYDYRIHYGRANKAGLYFEKEPDTKINTRGIQFESVFADINGDGRKDFYTPTAHFGIGTIVRALLSGSASLELQFYLMNADRSFSDKPDHTHKTSASISISGGRVDLPVFQVANVSANEGMDLLVGERQHRLIVHQSDDKKLFGAERMIFNVDLPRDGAKVKKMDLNGDGKDDLVLPFDAQDSKETRNQLRLLMMQ